MPACTTAHGQSSPLPPLARGRATPHARSRRGNGPAAEGAGDEPSPQRPLAGPHTPPAAAGSGGRRQRNGSERVCQHGRNGWACVRRGDIDPLHKLRQRPSGDRIQRQPGRAIDLGPWPQHERRFLRAQQLSRHHRRGHVCAKSVPLRVRQLRPDRLHRVQLHMRRCRKPGDVSSSLYHVQHGHGRAQRRHHPVCARHVPAHAWVCNQ